MLSAGPHGANAVCVCARHYKSYYMVGVSLSDDDCKNNSKGEFEMKARIPKNMGGGAQNMNSMIKQAQKMQDQITVLQEDIEGRDFSAVVGGGAVEVVVTGK